MNAKIRAGGDSADRKARAIALAADAGPKVAAAVRLIDFREPTAAEAAHGATLAKQAARALKRHGKVSA